MSSVFKYLSLMGQQFQPLKLSVFSLLFSILCLLSSQGSFAGDDSWSVNKWGKILYQSLDSAPFPHSSRADGYERNGDHYSAEKHYSDSTTAFFVPDGFHASDMVDLLVYFHGHNNHVKKAIEEFNLLQQVSGASKNVIFIFPQGPHEAPDSSGGRLEEPGAFRDFIAECLNTLNQDGVIESTRAGRIILAGHSGAYRVISFILEHGGMEKHLEEVYLLDASYGRIDQFTEWAMRRPQARLRSIFTSHLAPENVMMMAELDRKNVPFQLRRYVHLDPMPDEWPRIAFVHAADLSHNDTVFMFEHWLRASSLDDIR